MSPTLTAGSPTVHDYLERIGNIRAEGVASIIARGGVLNDAIDRLPHGAWKDLCAQLPFSQRHAHRLRSIAAHPVLANRTFLSFLPDDVTTLYILSRLAPELIEQAIADGRIHPGMRVADAKALAGGSSSRGPDSHGARPGGRRQARPWTVVDTMTKIRRLVAPCPPSERGPLARDLHTLADLLVQEKSTTSGSRGGGKPDSAVVHELINFAMRSASMRWHPDRPTGDVEKMQQVNVALEWLRRQAATLNGGRHG